MAVVRIEGGNCTLGSGDLPNTYRFVCCSQWGRKIGVTGPRMHRVNSQELFAMNTYAYPGCCTAMLPTIQRNSFPHSQATR
jgi:hypothetical protein